jgi:hypothetical protein
MEKQSCISQLVMYVYRHPIPSGWGSGMGLCAFLPSVLQSLKIIINVYIFALQNYSEEQNQHLQNKEE